MGYVYVARNKSILGLVKIGFTDQTPEKRIPDLNNHTGVPGKYEVVYRCQVNNAKHLEGLTHSALGPQRDSKDREFFRVTAAHARRIIRATASRVGIAILAEVSDPRLDVEDRAAIREKIGLLETERDHLSALPRSWNPFLKGRMVVVNGRRQALTDQIAKLRGMLDELEDP